MTKRTHLTPALGIPAQGVHAMRRGGARMQASERVSLAARGATLEGWALNVSRGGVRVILEGGVALGDVFELTLGDLPPRQAQIVWIQEEPDGVVCGMAYTLKSGETPKTVPPPPPGSRSLP